MSRLLNCMRNIQSQAWRLEKGHPSNQGKWTTNSLSLSATHTSFHPWVPELLQELRFESFGCSSCVKMLRRDAEKLPLKVKNFYTDGLKKQLKKTISPLQQARLQIYKHFWQLNAVCCINGALLLVKEFHSSQWDNKQWCNVWFRGK